MNPLPIPKNTTISPWTKTDEGQWVAEISELRPLFTRVGAKTTLATPIGYVDWNSFKLQKDREGEVVSWLYNSYNVFMEVFND